MGTWPSRESNVTHRGRQPDNTRRVRGCVPSSQVSTQSLWPHRSHSLASSVYSASTFYCGTQHTRKNTHVPLSLIRQTPSASAPSTARTRLAADNSCWPGPGPPTSRRLSGTHMLQWLPSISSPLQGSSHLRTSTYASPPGMLLSTFWRLG